MPPMFVQQNNNPQFQTPAQQTIILNKKVKQQVYSKSLAFPTTDRSNYNPGAQSVQYGYNSKQIELNLHQKCDSQLLKPKVSMDFDTVSSIYQVEDLQQFEKQKLMRNTFLSSIIDKSDNESVMSSFSAFKTLQE
ncbi:hypothetical protein SS50377_23501 [Spironucleus salmonicida]|uniref:Uncharacterized protein n=1 Tax=Spironucleus salmonicida TaxID=348837 RepID=V6LZI1_9EUKA|nr:hypothetical protein SS50377_23501 [Spironucleus salmonicida]|eukprot:EST46239.1 Hypothetical protein SS50377_13835 [Spironucleus salmonicida]